MSSVICRKYVLKSHFSGLPKRGDLEIVEETLLPLQDGGEKETVVYVAENLLSILSCFRVSVPGGVAVGGSLHEVSGIHQLHMLALYKL